MSKDSFAGTQNLMARLLVNPGAPTQWEIPLKPGLNSIGRAFSNDFKLTDVSVSGAHCQIVVENGQVLLRDLGSTNGSFVNRAPVQEALLQAGQTVTLGRVDMLFDLAESGAPAPALAVPAAPALPRLAIAAGPVPQAAPAPVAVAAPLPRLASPIAMPPPPVAAPTPPMAAVPAVSVGSGPCKYHPKSAGRYFCSQCQAFFCELCVNSRMVGGVLHKFCRHCATECIPVQVKLARPPSEKGFFSRLPGVVAYPFRGSGFFVLLVCTIVVAALGFISGGFAIFSRIAFYGYLFSFIQNIIHSTASDDEELPGWPAFDSLLGGFLRLAAAALTAFGAPITLAALKFFWEMDVSYSAILITLLLGCFYFPMALLAVAMKDSPLAANPLIVFPAIVKAPAEYLVTVVLLAGVVGVHLLGGFLAAMLALTSMTTKSMSTFFLALGLQLFWSFVKVYLLAVDARLLGLLYVTKKHKLGWFSR